METRTNHSETTRIEQPANAHLLKLPSELLLMIDNHLKDPVDKFKFENISYHLHCFFSHEQKRNATILAKFVIDDNFFAVKKMLDKNPDLIKETSHIITDEAGRRLQGTAYQLALGMRNIPMIEVVSSYFEKHPDGEAEKEKQFSEQHANRCYEIYDFEQLAKTLSEKLVDGAPTNIEILTAFQKELTPEHVIKTGEHFNPYILYRAMECYDTHVKSWSSALSKLFVKEVIIFLINKLPVNMRDEFLMMYQVAITPEKITDLKCDQTAPIDISEKYDQAVNFILQNHFHNYFHEVDKRFSQINQEVENKLDDKILQAALANFRKSKS